MPPEAGIFEAYQGDAVGTPVALMAINAPAAESDLTPAPEASRLPVSDTVGSAAAATVGNASPAELEARQGAWRWLVLLAEALLGIEVLMASRGWRGVAPAGTITEGEAA